jgi:uncharacterized oxidoreductase
MRSITAVQFEESELATNFCLAQLWLKMGTEHVVPLALTAVYSATKAALHSYALSQRFLLRDSGVRVLEVAPPWVRTELLNSQDAEQAVPLDQFIAETLQVLETEADEIVVEAAKPLRANPGPQEHALVNGFNQQMVQLFTSR